MSRLATDPLYGPQAAPGAAPFDAGFGVPRRRRGGIAPPLDPAEADSVLAGLGEAAIGGLGYIGKVADKAVGARAIRGLLGGRPREALSLIPFSDTLGLTSEADTVYGRQLLQDAGLVGPDNDPNSFDLADAAGVAAEIALDPATYLGFGTLTRAGSLAKRLGHLPNVSTARRIGGFAARESDLLTRGPDARDVLRGLGLDDAASAPLISRELEQAAAREGVALRPQITLDAAGNFIDRPDLATPLAGAIGVGLPFGRKVPLLTDQAVGRAVATALPLAFTGLPRVANAAVERATGFSPGRALGALFDPAAKGMYTAEGQAIAREVVTPREQQLRAAGMTDYARALADLDPLLAGRGGADVLTAMRYARTAAEEAAVDPALAARAAAAFGDRGAAELRRIGGGIGAVQRQLAGYERELGIELPDLADQFVKYAMRSKDVLPRQAGESVFSYVSRVTRDYAAKHASQLQRDAIFRDLPGGTDQINQWVRNPALSGRGNQRTAVAVAADLQRDIAGYGVNVTPEIKAQTARLADWLKSLPDDYAKAGRGFFSEDLPADMLTRVNRSAQARTAAEATYEGIARHAAPLGPDATAVPVETLLREAGLTGLDEVGNVTSHLIASRKLGVSPNDLAKFGIPADIARDMRRLNEAWRNPSEMVPVLAAWDAFSQLFKTHLTAPFVSFHTRNAVSAIFNMWRNDLGPGELTSALGEGWRFTRGGGLTAHLPGMDPAGDAGRQLVEELIGQGVAYVPRSSNTADVLGAGGEQVLRRPNLPRASGRGAAGDLAAFARGFVPKSLAEANPLNVQGVGRDEDVFTWVRQMRAAGQQIEDWSRVSHYIAKRRQGFAPSAAAAEVKKYQLDYANMTPFEKNVMKRIVPWYSFSRRNLPPILEEAAADPAKLAAALRATTRGRTPGEFTPAYIAEGAAVPVPGAPPGEQRYVRSFGLPIEDELVKTAGNLARGDLTRAGQSALAMTQPQLRVPLELIFGRQLISGRPLEELRPSATVAAAVPDEMIARRLTQAVNATPLSRYVGTVDRLTDARKPLFVRAVNAGTGFQVGDVDVERQRDVAYKRMLDGLLTGRPGVRRQEGVYLNREAMADGRVAPEDVLLYRMYKLTEQRIRDVAARRRAAAGE